MTPLHDASDAAATAAAASSSLAPQNRSNHQLHLNTNNNVPSSQQHQAVVHMSTSSFSTVSRSYGGTERRASLSESMRTRGRSPPPPDAPSESHHEEAIPPELLPLLNTVPLEGLSTEQVSERVSKFGFNEISEKHESKIIKFLRYFTGPISYLIEVACIIAAILGDWTEFGILLALLIVNAIIGFVEESKAEDALNALRENLASSARVWRNKTLCEIPTRDLVPGDIVVLRLGDIIPADCKLLGLGSTGEQVDEELMIDQAALTGESLAVNRGKDKIVYSSSVVKQGQMLSVVVHTGPRTFIGRAANLIAITNEPGSFQKLIGKIGNYLIYISLAFVVIIFIVRLAQGFDFLSTLREVIVLLIAAIPVGLPTVMSTTMALGAKQLAAKNMVVKRLPAVEEFASVGILCSDKTGTLTLNQLTFDNPFVCSNYTEEDLLLHAYFTSEAGANDAIELAVRHAAKTKVGVLKDLPETEHYVPGYKLVKYIPFNPHSKYTEARVRRLSDGYEFRCIKGAPHVIIHMSGESKKATEAVKDFAKRGLRALGVARTQPMSPDSLNASYNQNSTLDSAPFELVGLISLLDPPRPDSGATISECKRFGVDVKMITGDQVIIGKEVARRLGMNRCILDANSLTDTSISEEMLIRRCEKCDGFGQVIPEHKYRVVELLQKKGHLVGMTGDGVNDAPALKKANVGIAVHGCTDAARSASDIVLLAPGLSTIIDGIKTSRAIFQRMRSYAIYRITSTIHFLVFFFVAIVFFNFSLPHILIILIAVLNDLATLVIAVDNVLISSRPDKWRLGQLLTLSTVLALLLTVFSILHYEAAQASGLTYQQTQTVIYLQVSSCPHFVIFSTRVGTYLWRSPPGVLFTVAIIGTQLFAMFMSIFGWEALGAAAVGYEWGLGVIAVSFACMFVLDLVKVAVFRSWSFELTTKLWPVPSRKRRLAEKQRERAERKRARKLWARVAAYANVVWAAKEMQQTAKITAKARAANTQKPHRAQSDQPSPKIIKATGTDSDGELTTGAIKSDARLS